MPRAWEEVSEAAIETAYMRSGNRLGWRLLYSPSETLRHAEIAFLGLNPGGRVDRPDLPRFATQNSAYESERWAEAIEGQSRLQTQVCDLFECLGVRPIEVLSGNLVPFRSPSWHALPNRKEALEYGRKLWRTILFRARPRLIIGMGRDVFRQLSRILDATLQKQIPLGWGRIKGTRSTFEHGVLVGLPHLSRFSVINRPASESGLAALFEGDWRP